MGEEYREKGMGGVEPTTIALTRNGSPPLERADIPVVSWLRFFAL